MLFNKSDLNKPFQTAAVFFFDDNLGSRLFFISEKEFKSSINVFISENDMNCLPTHWDSLKTKNVDKYWKIYIRNTITFWWLWESTTQNVT